MGSWLFTCSNVYEIPIISQDPSGDTWGSGLWPHILRSDPPGQLILWSQRRQAAGHPGPPQCCCPGVGQAHREAAGPGCWLARGPVAQPPPGRPAAQPGAVDGEQCLAAGQPGVAAAGSTGPSGPLQPADCGQWPPSSAAAPGGRKSPW